MVDIQLLTASYQRDSFRLGTMLTVSGYVTGLRNCTAIDLSMRETPLPFIISCPFGGPPSSSPREVIHFTRLYKDVSRERKIIMDAIYRLKEPNYDMCCLDQRGLLVQKLRLLPYLTLLTCLRCVSFVCITSVESILERVLVSPCYSLFPEGSGIETVFEQFLV